ncbi:MAG: hypothetical protein DI570_11220 [Phenylobacterium zucineum]|nr:MAG: hypothetical protein DI570_11220 [Phenylobacterium zucineum]
MVTSIDSSLLLSLYQSRAGVTGGAVATSTGTTAKKVAPTAPWNQQAADSITSAAVKASILGRKFINEGAAQLDLKGASADYRKMFALYQGLGTLMGVAERASAAKIPATELAKLQKVFASGLSEISDYIGGLDLDQFRMVQGETAISAKTAVGVPRTKTEYTTDPLVSGSADTVVPAFQGSVQFKMSVKRSGTTIDVPIDLDGMGSQPRTMVNVVNYINGQLKTAGVDARVSSQRIAGADKTTTVNGKSVVIGKNPDQFAMKINVSAGETLTFSAPTTANAVYVAQNAGNPNPDGKSTTNDSTEAAQFLKFQTDTSTVPAPLQGANEANWVDGRIFSETLGPEVKTIRKQVVGPDGAVYMLADVVDKVGGQEIKGAQDVALLKYDAAGKLVFARTLGAADTASGLGLAINADGKIAVAGSVVGELGGATNGPLNSTGSYAKNTDSFVTLYDNDGQELWTQRRGARANDEASEVAFGADGTVYVQGRTSSVMPGTSAIGGSDSYIEAFKADAAGKVQTLFTTTVGTVGTDKPAGMVVDGNSIIVASNEDGRGVLRRYDVSSGTPVLSSTRDLGDLKGGAITGIAMDGGNLVVVGTTNNPALGGLNVTRAHAGGSDAFAAKMSADLSGGGNVAYYGGAGEDKATSLAVSGGKVYIGGSAGTDLPGNPEKIGTKDGFLTQLDVDAGTIDWSRRFTGKDGFAAPTSIAVDPSGASVLDRLGLPKGELDMTDSAQLTAVSSLRAGDQFTIKTGLGRSSTVTIDAKETLDTLAQKIRRASGFQAKVTIATAEGKRYLRIEPSTNNATLEFGPGKNVDKDALSMLGIPEGIVRKTKTVDGKTTPADGKSQLYGLGLPSDLNLSDDTERKHTLAVIGSAMGIVRQIYKDLVAKASGQTTQAAAREITGTVPTYLTNQISNYQAALARLGGG